MNGLIVSLCLLMQTPDNVPSETCTQPFGFSPCHGQHDSQDISSPCYGSSRWRRGRTVCGSCSVGGCGCCLKPIGDMHPHYPYEAQPRMYYYLRPYQYLQVREKAAQAETLGAHAKVPYSNALFRDAYLVVEAKFKAAPTPAPY